MLRSSRLACSMIINCTRLAVRSWRSCWAIFWSVCNRLPATSNRNCSDASTMICRTAAALPPARTPSTTACKSCPAIQTCPAGMALCTRVMIPRVRVKPRWVCQTSPRTRGTPISEARALRAVSRKVARSPGPRPSSSPGVPPDTGAAPRCARFCSRELSPRPEPALPPPRPPGPERPSEGNPVILFLSVVHASSVLNVAVSGRFAPDTRISGERSRYIVYSGRAGWTGWVGGGGRGSPQRRRDAETRREETGEG